MNALFNPEEFTATPSKPDPFPEGYFKGRPRPGRFSDEVKRLAVEDLLEEVMEWFDNDDDDDVDEVRTQLLDVVDPHRDGFEIAKRLENYHGWDADAALVGILDGADFYSPHKKAVSAWIRDNNVVPKLALRASVRIKTRQQGEDTIAGVIVRITDEGDYVIACPSENQDINGTCGFVMAWGDVEDLNPVPVEIPIPSMPLTTGM